MVDIIERRYIMSTLCATNEPWRDELADAVSLQQTGPGVSRNSTESTVDFTTGSNLSDFLFLNVQLNHDKKLSANVYPHIHWFQAASASPNFLLYFRWQSNSAAKVTSWSSIVCNKLVATYTTGTIVQISYSSPISQPTATGLSDIIQFKLFRDNANTSGLFVGADGYGATVGVLAFDVHFAIDTFGSYTEYVKV